MEDVRICAIGDSFVAGVGDPEARGWVGRLAAAAAPVTLYGLGVRRETSRDVLARARREIPPRLPDGVEGRVVVSFGVNDTTAEHGTTRVPPDESAANLRTLLDQLRVPVLVVGPPPVADAAQNARIVALSARFAEVCDGSVVYVPVVAPLLDDGVWVSEVRAGDGAHPGADGYRRLADLVAPAWHAWVTPALAAALADLLDVAGRLIRDDLDRPTPCEGWDVRRLLEHVVGWHQVFAACARDAAGPVVDGSPTYVASADPVADLRRSAADLRRALARREAAVDLPHRGWTPVDAHVDELVAETLLHTWDLATAVGHHVVPRPDVLARAHRGLTRLLGESFAAVAFGPAREGGPDLSGLLARSGRAR